MNGFLTLTYQEIVQREDFNYQDNKGLKIRQHYRDKLPKNVFCYKDDFEKQMQYLKENGYTTITLDDVKAFFYQNKALPEKSVLLTFDDMYESIYVNAYPILKKYGFNAVGFLVSGWVLDDNIEYSPKYSSCISNEQMQEMNDVFEYANHTDKIHVRDVNGPATLVLDEEAFIADIERCERATTTKKVFAYPFGIYNSHTVEMLKNANFELAFTTDMGYNTDKTNPLKLRRNAVVLGLDIEGFKNMLN